MPQLPVVAIVGRPNVGKSSLLNALVGKRISIVQDMPGVTRDRVSMPFEIRGHFVDLVDTGGYGFVDPDALTEHIRHQIEIAMAEASLVLLLVDCQAGSTSADQEIASLLRRKGIKTVLVANKADGPKADTNLGDFARLGLGTPIGISALNDRNLDLLLDTIAANVDLESAPTTMPPPQMMVAIVGKRNAGKSTLVNTIAEIYEGRGDRVIVSEVPGTTRDSVDVRFEKEGKTLIVIDTAGVRKKKHIATNDIEFYSFHRAQRSIRRADVVLMLIDGTEPVSEPDKKLAQYIASEYKPVVIVVNKWDLTRKRAQEMATPKEKAATDSDDDEHLDVTDDADLRRTPQKIDDGKLMEKFREYLDEELKHIDYAPIAFTTGSEGRNVQSVIDLAQHLFNQASQRVSTNRLTEAVRDILQERHPSTPSGRRARIYYATQPEVSPPTIVFFVNKPEYFDDVYQRFMINRFRELLPYAEVPIKLVFRARERRGPAPATDLSDEAAVAPPPAPVKRPASNKTRLRRPQPKPHPKKASRKGPARGTRPH